MKKNVFFLKLMEIRIDQIKKEISKDYFLKKMLYGLNWMDFGGSVDDELMGLYKDYINYNKK